MGRVSPRESGGDHCGRLKAQEGELTVILLVVVNMWR